jgi:hypothetical protein
MQGSGKRSGCLWSRVCRMAPASGLAQWPSRASGAKVEGDAGQRQAIGLPVVKSVPTGASVGPCSIVARSGGSSWSRLRKAPARRTGCQRRAAIGGHRRQAKAMQISVAIAGERFPGERDADHRQASGLPWSRVCRMAPASGRAQWRSRASGARSKAMQITGNRSGCPWSRACRMAPASGRAQWPSRASGAKVEGDAGQRQPIGLPVVKGVPDGARFGPCSVAIAGERCQVEGDAGHKQPIGRFFVVSIKEGSHKANRLPASGRARWRSRASGTRSKAMQGSGRRSGCPWSRVSRLAPASGRAQWPSAPGERDSDLSGDRGRAVPRSKAMQGSGRRSGCPWSRVCRMALASGRAQSSPDQPVLRGLD